MQGRYSKIEKYLRIKKTRPEMPTGKLKRGEVGRIGRVN